MAQVVATRSIQSSFPSPSCGSLNRRVQKLKPAGFGSTLLSRSGRSKSSKAVRINAPVITAKLSARAEPQVLPVSPADVSQVAFLLPTVLHPFIVLFHFIRLCLQKQRKANLEARQCFEKHDYFLSLQLFFSFLRIFFQNSSFGFVYEPGGQVFQPSRIIGIESQHRSKVNISVNSKRLPLQETI